MNDTKKFAPTACGSRNFRYLCGAFHFERAVKLATPAGILFAQHNDISVSTPVRSVNAPAARSEWNATGKRGRFLFPAMSNFQNCIPMKETLSLPLSGIKARKSNLSVTLAKWLSLLFSARISTIVLVAACVAVWWHIATTPGTLAAQRAVAVDAICALPWLAALLINSTKEGGEL